MNEVASKFEDSEKGIASLKRFSVDKEKSRKFNIRTIMSYGSAFQMLEEGDYVKLYVDGVLMMSDTPMERRTNREFVSEARGEVMIAGLGIGLIIENLRDKVANGEVTRIVVYEKYQDVIDLVYPKYADLPLEVRCADILEYKPPKDETYDTIYFDIWPDICEDNLPQMAMLHKRWARHKRKGGWMDSWMCRYLRNERRKSYGSYGW